MALKVFVAGGTGVLGRASLPALVAAGHNVRSTARGDDKAALVRSWELSRSSAICTTRIDAQSNCGM